MLEVVSMVTLSGKNHDMVWIAGEKMLHLERQEDV